MQNFSSPELNDMGWIWYKTTLENLLKFGILNAGAFIFDDLQSSVDNIYSEATCSEEAVHGEVCRFSRRAHIYAKTS